MKTEHQDGQAFIKSKERVQKHGEVFTPKWLVQQMLEYPAMQEKLRDMHATFLEPAAGEGAFLTAILWQKLQYVNQSPASRGEHWQYNTLWALMSIYGIEYLPDNLAIARQRMAATFMGNYRDKTGRDLSRNSDLYRSMRKILHLNLVQGNTLTRKNALGDWIVLQEWEHDDRKNHKRLVTRKPFYYDSLFPDPYRVEGEFDLFNFGGQDDAPLRQYKQVNVLEIWKEELMTNGEV